MSGEDGPVSPSVAACVGGWIDEVNVSLCFYSDDMDPDELTQLLGTAPTSAGRKGDLSKSGHPARIGRWILRSATPRSAPIERQIEDLLSRVTADPAVWSGLAERFRIQIRCGLHLDAWNRGDELSAAVMRELATRGISLGLDIYGPDDVFPESLRTLKPPRRE